MALTHQSRLPESCRQLRGGDRACMLIRSGLISAALLMAGAASATLKPTDRFSLHDLERESPITPRQFGNLFGNFRYQYSPYVQPVEIFLSDRIGDCDDYALLADHILSRQGYRTRFVQVSMAGSDIAHAICYVAENKAYLDYNNRRYEMNLERSGATLREIAGKVADSFEKNWTSATEYTFSYETYRKTSRYTVVKTDPPDRDPDLRQPSSR
jgi:hypothetical protein